MSPRKKVVAKKVPQDKDPILIQQWIEFYESNVSKKKMVLYDQR